MEISEICDIYSLACLLRWKLVKYGIFTLMPSEGITMAREIKVCSQVIIRQCNVAMEISEIVDIHPNAF